MQGGQATTTAWWPRVRSLVLRWLITTLAIFVAVWLVPGIDFRGPGWELGLVAAIFGLVNTLLRPILTLLTCSLVILTLGLFTLVINAALLLLTAWIAAQIGVEFIVADFWSALLGAILISIVSITLSLLAGETPLRVQVVRSDDLPRR